MNILRMPLFIGDFYGCPDSRSVIFMGVPIHAFMGVPIHASRFTPSIHASIFSPPKPLYSSEIGP